MFLTKQNFKFFFNSKASVITLIALALLFLSSEPKWKGLVLNVTKLHNVVFENIAYKIFKSLANQSKAPEKVNDAVRYCSHIE